MPELREPQRKSPSDQDAGATRPGRRGYLQEGLGRAPTLLVELDVGEQVPAVPALGAERDVVGVLGGRAHDHVVHGEGRLVGERVILPQVHLPVTLRRPVAVACGRRGSWDPR